VSEPASRDHYSYTLYNDANTARNFDHRRFGGPIGDLVASTQAAVLADFIGPISNRTILDVGTGTGRAALLMARAGARVTGVDASEEMLAIARQRASGEGAAIDFRSGDAHALEFPDRAFDVVVSLRVIMHTPRWADCVGELCRVADQLVILDYPSSRSSALIQSKLRQILAAVGRPTEPYRVFSSRQVDAALQRCGFRVRAVHRQFVLPIALHKAVGSRRVTVAVERWLERLGLLRLFGSPVTVVAERCAP
jgi:2-polyprenyl-3-methyl-5-hydroxy-6-metoxy-1,4-benzoquinol methylase